MNLTSTYTLTFEHLQVGESLLKPLALYVSGCRSQVPCLWFDCLVLGNLQQTAGCSSNVL